VQYSHEHPEDGSLVRVLPGVYPARPGDIKRLVQQHRFFVLYPVRSAVRAGAAQLVSNAPVPEAYQPLPRMRWALQGEGHRYGWTLWDGTRQVGFRRKLEGDERLIPERASTWSHGLIGDRIASHWTWADDSGAPPWPDPPRVNPCYDVGYIEPADDC
jgi:hypothetical protein